MPKGDYREASTGDIVRHAGGRGLSHRPPGRLEGPCSPRHEALLAGAWKDLASLHRAALIRDHRRPRTASAWRPRALARRAALRWFGSFDSLCRRTPGGRGSQKWLRGPLPFGRGTASGTSSVATAARRAAARRCWRWWFEVGIVQSSVDESRASAGSVPCLCGKLQIYLFDRLRPDPSHPSRTHEQPTTDPSPAVSMRS